MASLSRVSGDRCYTGFHLPVYATAWQNKLSESHFRVYSIVQIYEEKQQPRVQVALALLGLFVQNKKSSHVSKSDSVQTAW